MKELADEASVAFGRVRQPGGAGKARVEQDPTLLSDSLALFVGELLHEQKFSLQANRKTREGDGHPDRDAQFVHLNESVGAALATGEPVISVDAKKKELVVDFKNGGRAWRPKGDPEEARVHDVLIEDLGRAVP